MSRVSGRSRPCSRGLRGRRYCIGRRPPSLGGEEAGPEAEAPGSVARRAHAPEDYAARRISMPTLSLAFRVLVRCPERGLPAPNRSSPYRKPHLTLPRQGRTRDPFTVQSNLFRPQQKHPGSALSATPDARPHPRAVSGAGCFWWRRRVPPPGPEALLRTGHQPRDRLRPETALQSTASHRVLRLGRYSPADLR